MDKLRKVANSKFGFDWRYVQEVCGSVVGAVTGGATRYLTPGNASTTYFPLYEALHAESVDRLAGNLGTASGAGQSDTLTVVKNGVDTAMTLTIANAASGATTANPVTLAAGDTLGIKIVSTAASAAANINAHMTVRKS